MQQPYQQHAGHDSLHGRPAVQCGAAAAPGSSRRQLGRAALRQRQPQQACTVVCSAANTLTGNGSLPLADKRILVTAPRQYATKLTTKLLEAGARPLWLPTIQIAELQHEPSQQALLESLRDLSRYDHLAFSSKNGITAVLGALQSWLGTREAAVEHIERSGIKCWALGADAEVLLEAGVKEVHRPREPSTQGLVQELIRCGEAQEKRVLCPVPRVLRPLVEPDVVPRFLTSLAQAGAEAVRVDAYETGVGCMPATCAAEWELLMEGELHAIAFSSTAEAQGLVHLMGGVGFVHQAVRAHSVVLAAHGPYTAAGAASVLGVPVTCVSRDSSTFDGLVEALSNTIGGVPTPRQQWQMTEGAKLLRRAQQQGGAVLPAGPSFDEAWKEDAPPEVWPA